MSQTKTRIFAACAMLSTLIFCSAVVATAHSEQGEGDTARFPERRDLIAY